MNKDKETLLDELLIMRIREGSNDAFALFVKRWHSKLVWHSYQTLGDKDEAQDVVQDCWTALVKSVQRLKDISSYKAWMLRVVRNKSIDRIRQITRERTIRNELEPEEIDSSSLQLENQIQLVTLGIKKLPPDLKEVLQLFYLQTLSIQEISEIMNVPVGTVKSRLYRARTVLKKVYDTYAPQFESI